MDILRNAVITTCLLSFGQLSEFQKHGGVSSVGKHVSQKQQTFMKNNFVIWVMATICWRNSHAINLQDTPRFHSNSYSILLSLLGHLVPKHFTRAQIFIEKKKVVENIQHNWASNTDHVCQWVAHSGPTFTVEWWFAAAAPNHVAHINSCIGHNGTLYSYNPWHVAVCETDNIYLSK